MKVKDPIVFKSEDSLWRMLENGTRTWDARLYDMSDDRIYRLSWGKFDRECPVDRQPFYSPQEDFVGFRNKVTGEVLKFRYRGMEFIPWAPGWCFLQLGEKVSHHLRS